MELSKVEVALYGLLQTVGQTTENEYVEYLHKDGTKHRLLWQDVVHLVEGAVAKTNAQDTFHQLTSAVHEPRPWHGSNYNEGSCDEH